MKRSQMKSHRWRDHRWRDHRWRVTDEEITDEETQLKRHRWRVTVEDITDEETQLKRSHLQIKSLMKSAHAKHFQKLVRYNSYLGPLITSLPQITVFTLYKYNISEIL
jgi:hypothetical protein